MSNKQLYNKSSSSRGDRQNGLYGGSGSFSGVCRVGWEGGGGGSLEAAPSVQGGKQETRSALSRGRLELLIQSSLSLIFIYLICTREIRLEVEGHSVSGRSKAKLGLLSEGLSCCFIFLVFGILYCM